MIKEKKKALKLKINQRKKKKKKYIMLKKRRRYFNISKNFFGTKNIKLPVKKQR
jgi:hypothetical protein